MYEFLVGLHNLLRWLVLLGAAYALIKSYRGLFSRAVWTPSDKRAGIVYTSLLNLQLVLGLLLYVVSPLVRGAVQDMGAAMANDRLRFFVVEHLTFMILAIVIAQLGYSLGKRAPTDRGKFLRSSVAYTLATVLVLAGIPWWRSFIPWA